MVVDTIELFARERSSLIRFTLLEVRPEYYPSFLLGVEVDDEGFSARGDFWVGSDIWKTFLSDLQECERTRRGQVTLEGMSPGECLLTLTSIDSIGHFEVGYTIKRDRHGLRLNEISLSGAFPLDMEYFGQIVSQFQRWDKVVSSSNQ